MILGWFITTVLLEEQTADGISFFSTLGWIVLNFFIVAFMYSGFVPQQPPTTLIP